MPAPNGLVDSETVSVYDGQDFFDIQRDIYFFDEPLSTETFVTESFNTREATLLSNINRNEINISAEQLSLDGFQAAKSLKTSELSNAVNGWNNVAQINDPNVFLNDNNLRIYDSTEVNNGQGISIETYIQNNPSNLDGAHTKNIFNCF